MPNSYFQFKQFTIWQDRCAMKITTDGCLFGAVAAKEMSSSGPYKVLDIGTGTGLLSLMVAQQNRAAIIDALEINEAAAQQASENITASAWAQQIHIIQGDILTHQPEVLYGTIICNPPFYENQLGSPVAGRQQAHHSSQLTLKQLFHRVEKLLKPEGNFFVLMPYYRLNETISLAAQSKLQLKKQWLIKQTQKDNWFRSICCFGYKSLESVESVEICIRDFNNAYSPSFADLLRVYYLKL